MDEIKNDAMRRWYESKGGIRERPPPAVNGI